MLSYLIYVKWLMLILFFVFMCKLINYCLPYCHVVKLICLLVNGALCKNILAFKTWMVFWGACANVLMSMCSFHFKELLRTTNREREKHSFHSIHQYCNSHLQFWKSLSFILLLIYWNRNNDWFSWSQQAYYNLTWEVLPLASLL